MKIYKIFLILIIFFSLISCVKIPQESVELTDSILMESSRMHSLNIELINSIFKYKSNDIDFFIENKYAPTLVDNYKNLLKSKNLNVDSIMSISVKDLTKLIAEKRDLMQQELEIERVKYITSLNQDFEIHVISTTSLRNLLISASKMEAERQQLIGKIETLSKDKIDVSKLEEKINNILQQVGDVSETIESSSDTVEGVIDKIKN